jgi:hypothetical protein
MSTSIFSPGYHFCRCEMYMKVQIIQTNLSVRSFRGHFLMAFDMCIEFKTLMPSVSALESINYRLMPVNYYVSWVCNCTDSVG